MPLVDVTAAPRLLTIAGKTYTVGPLSLYNMGMLQRFIDDNCKSPLRLAQEECEELGVPANEREEWLAEPRRKSRGWKSPKIGIDSGWPMLLLGSLEGQIFFLYVALSAHEPGFTMDQAEEVCKAIDQRELNRIFNVAMDLREEDESEEGSDPKGPSLATSMPTSATTSSNVTESSLTPSQD